jgi:VIT1/CCC1 family predicted Fe2+/Mn2+ transporter
VDGRRRRILDPVERVSEVLFGLIMVLTFTGTLSVASAGRAEVREMLVGAIGCNLAWGIVDAVMYLTSSLANRGHGLQLFKAVQAAQHFEQARALILSALPSVVASVISPAEVESLRAKLAALPAAPRRAWFTAADFRGAIGVFLLVFSSTFPVVVPFLIVTDPALALRLSNTVAVSMLFLGGVSLGRFSGHPPAALGVATAALGIALVAITILLGG